MLKIKLIYIFEFRIYFLLLSVFQNLKISEVINPIYRKAFGTLSSKRRSKQLRILKRCLCLSVIDLGLNLPNYLVRLYMSLASEETLEKAAQNGISLWLQDISQLLYFAQVINYHI